MDSIATRETTVLGSAVTLAVLWQRYMGALTVSVPVAAAIAGLVAAVASYHASTRVSTAILRD